MTQSTRLVKISRRGVLMGAGTVAGSAAMASSAQAHSRSPAERVDVVIVGGGFAGVTAAREVKRAGRSVVLLEARDRLGGRTFSSLRNGAPLEYGGMWVHWSQPNVWSEIQRYGLDIAETSGVATPERVYLRSGGRTRVVSFERILDPLISGFGKVLAEAREVFPRPYETFFAREQVIARDAMSVAGRIASLSLTTLERDLVSAYFATSNHAHLDQSSYVEAMRSFALVDFSLERLNDSLARFKLKDGTGALIEAIRADAGIEPRLGDPVVRVSQDADGATIETESGVRYLARAVVVTLPLNVLTSVEFSPALNEAKRQHSRERHSGSGIKGYAHIRRNVGMVQCFAPDPEPITNAFTDHASPEGSVLIFFGPSGSNLNSTDPAAVQAALRRFIPDVEVAEVESHDWNNDPYSLGTWCNYRPGQLTRYFPANREREGRLFFASADTATGWRGTIDGAIERGLRMGVEVHEFLTGAE